MRNKGFDIDPKCIDRIYAQFYKWSGRIALLLFILVCAAQACHMLNGMQAWNDELETKRLEHLELLRKCREERLPCAIYNSRSK